MTWFIAALVTWRIANLLVNEAGIFSFAQRLRDLFNTFPDKEPHLQSNFVAGILSCVWCASFWIGIGVATVTQLQVIDHAHPAFNAVFSGFALSAGAIVLDAFIKALYAHGIPFHHG